MAKEPIRSSLAWIVSSQGRLAIDALRSQYLMTSVSLRNGVGKGTTFHRSMSAANKIKTVCNRGLDKVSAIFARQFNVITAQKIKHSTQMLTLYNRIYDRETARSMVSKLGHNFVKNAKGRPLGFLFGAILFSWEKERIHDEDILRCAEDMNRIEALSNASQSISTTLPIQNCSNKNIPEVTEDSWEVVCHRDNFQAWRRPLENSALYEYKVFGSFFDIPARAFFAIQVDLEYRKQWDNLVISLDLVDRDRDTGSEVVRWVMHYPFPMYSREYLFKRRFKVDHDKKTMIIINRAVDHPEYPVVGKYVRVTAYKSEMVIKPHGDSFDKDGLDFVMTYYDDPQAVIPSSAYNWMASSGVTDFMEKLHSAAKQLTHKGRKPHQHVTEGWMEQAEKIPM